MQSNRSALYALYALWPKNGPYAQESAFESAKQQCTIGALSNGAFNSALKVHWLNALLKGPYGLESAIISNSAQSAQSALAKKRFTR